MRLLRFSIDGLRLYADNRLTMDLYAVDAVRDPAYVHQLPKAAKTISSNTVIGIAGINASGKTTLLRATELVLGITGGLPLGSLNQDLIPLYDIMEPKARVKALFEQNGKFYRLDSSLGKTGNMRNPLRFLEEKLWLNHGKLSRVELAKSFEEVPDPNRWTIKATRLPGKNGGKEPAYDGISICWPITGEVDIISDLTPIMPSLDANPAQPVLGLFDPTIETLTRDSDGGIHLKFRDEQQVRNVTPASLVNMVSAGTLRGGAIIGRALETLRSGGYLLVDELENSINKQLVFSIIDLFASPITNPHGATMMFTTHYPELLDHFTRKDCIWFTIRTGNGFAVKNLSDYLDRPDLKKSVSFFANKVRGTAPSYAAIRALHDYAREYANA